MPVVVAVQQDLPAMVVMQAYPITITRVLEIRGGDGGTGATIDQTDGEDGTFPGGGGSGAKNHTNSTTNFGGVGGHGRVIITVLSPANIVLKDVRAKNVGSVNYINWETAREEAGDAFEVQRSSDGRHFENVAYIPAQGDDKGSRYIYMDENPLPGVSYYRLKILNVDGSTYKSDIVTARSGISTGTFAVSASPNPVKDILTLNISGDLAKEKQIVVIDMTGKVMYQSENVSQSGNMEINMANWPGGIYMVQCTDASGTKSVKISKE